MTSEPMQGTRRFPIHYWDEGRMKFRTEDCRPGDYWKDCDGWRGITPNGLRVWLKAHTVTEDEGGRISVLPSIETSNGEGGLHWHGYLTNGEWKEC